MKNIKLNMSDIGFGANVLGIAHGYIMINKLKPNLAERIDYLNHKLCDEDMKQTNCKFYNTVYNASLEIYNKNLNDLNNGNLVITVGGDHSLALGSVKASMEATKEEIGLIWIDAHADLNTFEISESGNIHGMPVSGLLGINDEKYNNLGNKKRIKPENIVYFATRAVDNEEKKLIEKYDIKEYSDKIIKNKSFDVCLAEAIDYLKKITTKVHISLDLDGINPKLIKGVSTPVVGGLELEDPIKLIREINKNFEIVSIDIVEYNPLTDVDEATVEYLENLLNDISEIEFK